MVKAIIRAATVTGLRHRNANQRNQDAFKIHAGKDYWVVAVADGVGSLAFSRYGAKAICKSVCHVAKQYNKHRIDGNDVCSEIVKVFQQMIPQRYAGQCATTCLFAIFHKDGELLVGQAGDGMVALGMDGNYKVVSEKTEDFANIVHPINATKEFHGWKAIRTQMDFQKMKRLNLVLATDGVSEDVLPEKRDLFLEYLVNETRKNRDVKRILSTWDVPGSSDDKTIAIMELIDHE